MKKILAVIGVAITIQAAQAGPNIGISLGNGLGFSFSNGGTSVAVMAGGGCYQPTYVVPAPYVVQPVVEYYCPPRYVRPCYQAPQQYIMPRSHCVYSSY